MLLSRSGRSASSPQRVRPMADWGGWSLWLFLMLLTIAVMASHVFAQSKGHKKKQTRAGAARSVSPGEQSLPNIPLPIAHEAKGLVLPDFDGEGHLRASCEPATTRRIAQRPAGFEPI